MREGALEFLRDIGKRSCPSPPLICIERRARPLPLRPRLRPRPAGREGRQEGREKAGKRQAGKKEKAGRLCNASQPLRLRARC